MSFCHQCGSSITNGSAFCPQCGTAVLSRASAQTQTANSEQASYQQTNPAPHYAPQPAYTLQHKPVSKSNKFGLIALILVAVALLLNIVGAILSYSMYPSDMKGEMIFRAILGLLIPFALSAFVPLMTQILVKTGSAKAAKPLMTVVLCILAIQVLSAVICTIQFKGIMNGNVTTPLYSFVSSINGAEFIKIPYDLIMRVSWGAISIQTILNLGLLLCADILYILKNIFALVGLNKISRI